MVNDLTDGTANKGYRILVVDDEEDLCEILKFNLETEGYTVETANSAEEALTLDIANFNLLLLLQHRFLSSSLPLVIVRTIPLQVSTSVPTTISQSLSLFVR